MAKIRRCAFCGAEVPPGIGLMYVKNDGTVLWFCSSKCFKSYKMGRDPKRTPWSAYYLGGKGGSGAKR